LLISNEASRAQGRRRYTSAPTRARTGETPATAHSREGAWGRGTKGRFRSRLSGASDSGGAQQIIFEKDGYNTSAESPVADGLRHHLELLKTYDSEVVTVSQLLEISPFFDIGPDHPAFPYAKALHEAGYAVMFAVIRRSRTGCYGGVRNADDGGSGPPAR